jgi:alpha-tubulin suppressor-like RCC1 family protein
MASFRGGPRPDVRLIRSGFAHWALAAALLLVLPTAGCGGGGPRDPVASAAGRTLEKQTAHFELAVQSGRAATFTGTGAFSDPQQAVEMTTQLPALGANAPSSMEIRLRYPAVYLNFNGLPLRHLLPSGKSWVRVDLRREVKRFGVRVEQLATNANQLPSGALAPLRGSKDAKRLGSDTIDGVQATHYRVRIDLNEAVARATPRERKVLQRLLLAEKSQGISGVPATADVWVSEDGLVRRVGERLLLIGHATMTFSDYGAPVHVGAPPADETIDVSGLLAVAPSSESVPPAASAGTLRSRRAVRLTGVTAAAIEAGGAHTCARTASGGVECWGGNPYGQLGCGACFDRHTPVNVSGLASGVSAIAAGGYHTCALTRAGGVKCWGDNEHGQLGDGTHTGRSTPVSVSGLASGVSAIATGGSHTCAVTTSGGVKCWGYNSFGQLGNGTTTDRSTPANVSGLASGVSAITAGGSHTCALTASGGVKCWGNNGDGELGDGTTTERHTPVDVLGLTSAVSAIAASDNGWHTCALTVSAGVKCWGDNEHGQLGDGTTTNRSTPVDVSGLTNGVSATAPGYLHTCALTVSGGVKCWGYNSRGQLGDGTHTRRSTPVDVSGLARGVSAIAAGGDEPGGHTCALTASGGVRCWGLNDLGELGDATTRDRSTPVGVVGFGAPAKCKVPNVKGKTLARARNAIVKAHCSVGKVTKAFSKKRKGTVAPRRRRFESG